MSISQNSSIMNKRSAMVFRIFSLPHVFVFLFSVFLFTGCGFGGVSANDQPKLVITTEKGKVEYIIEVAATHESREKGLMFRTSLPQKHGMFFVYENPGHLTFWMKNTLIPLDMIFLDSNYSVIYIQKNAQPCKNEPCDIYGPTTAAQYVLEINGGESDSQGIKVGDTAEVTK